ncbi:HK97 family phage prohead protease [Halobacillus sp. A5]|uniref:HK97 family phage prohead protease n=1 Tax=Halobacillus sp. A5 TaxID=2880263 RepID=UPI0020A678A2|nr:HK97 family phage prohead protease [Halobacillus sp. A5]MCP3026002.1 HK97 family phage prohead protease [Halobacillus sp. A5]
MNKETRTLTMPIELRASENDESKQVIVGYALKFNSESEDLGGFVEIIDPSALNGADMSDVRGLFNHDPNMVLGRSKSGSLTLEVDEFGLKYIIDPPDTSFARDLAFSMGRGDIDQSSFGFGITYDGDEWKYDEKRDIYVRKINQFHSIVDVSVVTYPAYQATESVVAQRSLEDYKQNQEEIRQAKVREEERKLKQKQIEIELELF